MEAAIRATRITGIIRTPWPPDVLGTRSEPGQGKDSKGDDRYDCYRAHEASLHVNQPLAVDRNDTVPLPRQ